MARNKILQALTHIVNAELTPETVGGYWQEIAAVGNDRAAAILLAVNLEDALGLALEARLKIPRERLDELFGLNSPMGTFDSKIRMAYGVGMLEKTTRASLDVIRRIRNAFAHAVNPISFETREIADACMLLTPPTPFGPMAFPGPQYNQFSEARKRYQQTCQIIAHNLFVAAGVYRIMTSTAPPDIV
jgi:hypothetical protein